MTDITKLLEEHPLEWGLDRDEDGWFVTDANEEPLINDHVNRSTAVLICRLANALHAERQRNAAPANDSGDVDALRSLLIQIDDIVASHVSQLHDIERRLDAIAKHAMKVSGMIGMGVVPESKSTWLGLASAIANAARGSDE